ncbi:MAG: hypothetical protein ACTSRP_20745, partial [Candidatus Helarchaeota archaeon]
MVDTDGDGIPDNFEFGNKTDPTNPDTDLDGLSDLDEILWGTNPDDCDTDGDGLSDYDEINGFKTAWGIIRTNATIADTDNDGLNDYEEFYGLKTLYPTNPIVNDTDGDGLLDSAEYYSISRSLDNRERIKGYGLSRVQKFSFYFPQIEKASSAQLTVSINAGEGVKASKLSYSIYLNGVYLNSSGIVYNESYHTKVYDAVALIENKVKSGYGGYWEIRVSSDYPCLLEEFSLDASGYLNPLDADTDDDSIIDGIEADPEKNRGWSTDPFSYDTDGDGWSDYREIYIEDTNPLLVDSDGDGFSDPRDVAPLDNLVINVHIERAHMADTIATPILQLVLEDKRTGHAYYSTAKKATKDRKEDLLGYRHWYSTSAWKSDENDFYF